jgi:hypothetical protein
VQRGRELVSKLSFREGSKREVGFALSSVGQYLAGTKERILGRLAGHRFEPAGLRVLKDHVAEREGRSVAARRGHLFGARRYLEVLDRHSENLLAQERGSVDGEQAEVGELDAIPVVIGLARATPPFQAGDTRVGKRKVRRHSASLLLQRLEAVKSLPHPWRTRPAMP